MDMAREANDPHAGNGGSSHSAEFDSDERRMHLRAYGHWVHLLHGRAYPSIEDLDPGNHAEFGPRGVLLDFSGGIHNPAIRYLGDALREECSVGPSITHVAQVPRRSLLSRLTDHYLEIIANRAPIGFEAEFVATHGHNTLYRGLLMPFSSDGTTIDFVYGVINWKTLADAETQAKLETELSAAFRVPRDRRSAPRPRKR
jgi:hypothetical protein